MMLRYVDITVTLTGKSSANKPASLHLRPEQTIEAEWQNDTGTGYATLVHDGVKYFNVHKNSFIPEFH